MTAIVDNLSSCNRDTEPLVVRICRASTIFIQYNASHLQSATMACNVWSVLLMRMRSMSLSNSETCSTAFALIT